MKKSQITYIALFANIFLYIYLYVNSELYNGSKDLSFIQVLIGVSITYLTATLTYILNKDRKVFQLILLIVLLLINIYFIWLFWTLISLVNGIFK